MAAPVSSTHYLNNNWLSAVTTVEHSVELLLRFWLFMLLAMFKKSAGPQDNRTYFMVVRSHLILQTHEMQHRLPLIQTLSERKHKRKSTKTNCYNYYFYKMQTELLQLCTVSQTSSHL